MKNLPQAMRARSSPTMRTAGPFVCCLLSAALCTTTLTVRAADDTDDGAAVGKSASLKSVTVESNRDGEFLVDESTVGAKFPSPTRDIPQQVTVVTQDLMRTQADISLYRALDNVPGIVITPSADTATGNNINLRGFPARTDIYLDGIRDRGQYFCRPSLLGSAFRRSADHPLPLARQCRSAAGVAAAGCRTAYRAHHRQQDIAVLVRSDLQQPAITRTKLLGQRPHGEWFPLIYDRTHQAPG